MANSTKPTLFRCALALAAATILLVAAPSQASAASCAGKHATIVGTPGNDTIVGKKASDVIYGGGGDDKVSGGPNGNDTICGGGGDDVINGGRGNDSLYGGSGDDVLLGVTGGDGLVGDGGNDKLFGAKGPDGESGGPGDDALLGGRGPDSLHGGGGADTLYAGKATDREIDGEGGDDRLYGGRGNDPLVGGAGNDVVDGGLGDDTMNGDGGIDRLYGSHGRDDIFGGEGDEDVLRGDIGFDKLDGGPGERDIASFSTASEAVDVDLGGGSAYGDGRDQIASGTEDVVGSGYDDTLTGDAGANRLDGGAGYDELDGEGGADVLYGGPDGAECDDAMQEDACGERMATSAGPKVASVRSIDGSSSLSIHGYGTDDSISVSFQGSNFIVSDADHPFPDENVQGCAPSNGAAVCPGDAQTILIDVDGGNDHVAVDGSVPDTIEVRIDGGPGADDLAGGPGDDVIEAGDDDAPDVLDGAGGDDALIGARTDLHVPYNSGKSTLIGGPGSDVLVGGDPCDGDEFIGGAGNDNANFFRFTPGVSARIGGPVRRDGSPCTPGRILPSIEQLEGSPGPDVLIGRGKDSLIGHSGRDTLRD
jgi:Ca2+-binding RTX toxin-like protein